ncbi:MAG: DeoR/GlpR transcriptional regulator [Clostridia bacterium]|nr:DeoR/GlpR transcriptional regulator [Clostridia bacterium]
MVVYERQREIMNYLKKNQFSTVKELAKLVFTSESSVRRDIKLLEQKGYVSQIYGGVVWAEYVNSTVPVNLRDNYNSVIKEEIAKRAAEYIFDGATVFMDGSSTVRRIIKYMSHCKGVKIITNNQRVFEENNNPEIQLYCTGGLFVNQSNIFVGSTAESYVNNINADILFFSSQALSDDGWISDVSEEETSLRRVMLSRAKKKIFLCDSTKLGLRKTFTLCSKDDVDAVICDKALPWE